MTQKRIDVGEKRREELLARSGRRCECHGHDCPHHRPMLRCTRGLRGQGWHALQRADGGSDALWNLTAVCDGCWRAVRDA